MNYCSSRRLLLGFLVFTLTLGLDQASKLWAASHLANQPAHTYASILTLTYSRNYGGWGSLGADWVPWLRYTFFLILPGIFLTGLFIHALTSSKVNQVELAGSAFLLAGGCGNLVDRFRFGYVQDFLYLGYGPIGTNIFNIADMAILIGIACLLLGPHKKRRDIDQQSGL